MIINNQRVLFTRVRAAVLGIWLTSKRVITYRNLVEFPLGALVMKATFRVICNCGWKESTMYQN